MRPWVAALASCLALAFAAATAMAEHSALYIMKASGGNSSPAFEEFFAEYRGMLTGWWNHGGRETAPGHWRVIAAVVVRPGQRQPYFVISVAAEREDASSLMLTFAIPPFAQGNLFLAAHAAYDATVGAIRGERRGSYEWHGLGEREMVWLPSGPPQALPRAALFIVCPPEYPHLSIERWGMNGGNKQ